MLTNLYYISLLFTNFISSDNFCWCKNKRHFFNLNICTCFNFREILTCNRILEKRACQEPFFDTTMAIGNGVSFALHLIVQYVVQTEAEDRATQIRGEPTKKSIQRNGTEKRAVGIQNPLDPNRFRQQNIVAISHYPEASMHTMWGTLPPFTTILFYFFGTL